MLLGSKVKAMKECHPNSKRKDSHLDSVKGDEIGAGEEGR